MYKSTNLKLGCLKLTYQKNNLEVNPDSYRDYFKKELTSKRSLDIDYSKYLFGSQMPGRSFTGANKYRFGFNGYENENDWNGIDGGMLDFGARIHDSRLGRFLSIDPWYQKFPFQSPYAFAGNNPILFVDLYGYGPNDKGKEYEVKSTDSDGLSGIAKRELGAKGDEVAKVVAEIVKMNNIQNPDYIQVGQKINLPASSGTGQTEKVSHPTINQNVPIPFGDVLSNSSNEERYEGAGPFEYTDEIISGVGVYTKSLKNGGGYIVYSSAKSGKGLYWKPDARGLNNLKGVSGNVTKIVNSSAILISVALEVPEVIDGYQQNAHEGNKQLAGAGGNVGGGMLGGMAAGAGFGLIAGSETGPGAIVTAILGAGIGGYFGEEAMEGLYERWFGDDK